MCNNFPNIKVVKGNAFALLMPLKKRTFESCEPIDEDIDATQLTDLVVKFGGVQYQASTSEDGVQIIIPADIAVGTYSIVLTAMYQGSAIRAAYESAVTIVDYNSQSDAQQYIAGSPIVLDAAYVIGGTLTDAELEALKEEYREKNEQLAQAIADAEAAKAEWEQKAAYLDGVAQEETSQDILTAVGNIHIDTSDLAKQGANPDATLSATQSAAEQAAQNTASIGVIAGELESGKMEIVSAINEQGGAASADQSLGGLAQDISMLQVIADGVELQAGAPMPLNLGKALANKTYIKEIREDTITTMSVRAFFGWGSLTHIEFPQLRSIPEYAFQECSNLVEAIFPNVTTVSYNIFVNCVKLRKVDLLKMATSGGSVFNGAVNLIDLICGAGFSSNMNINTWSPNNALSATSNSLLTPEDIAAGFTNNREKLLYNIREHIAANLPDRTGLSSLTLTMSSAVKAAIQADTATANAFTNKNWTIA